MNKIICSLTVLLSFTLNSMEPTLDQERLRALKSLRSNLRLLTREINEPKKWRRTEKAEALAELRKSFESLEALAKNFRGKAQRSIRSDFSRFEKHVENDILEIRLCLQPLVA